MNQVVHAEARSSAPPTAVFEVLVDTARWVDWGGFQEAALAQPAPGAEPEGVGAVRRFRKGRTRSQEEVVGFERPHRFAYELRSGLPLRDYHAEVTLEPDGDGTRIRWHSTFRAKVPGTGWIYRLALGRFIAQLTERLARAAERSPAGRASGD